MKPGFLPVVKKRIIINNVYINVTHLISWDWWKKILKYRGKITSLVRFLQKVSTCKEKTIPISSLDVLALCLHEGTSSEAVLRLIA